MLILWICVCNILLRIVPHTLWTQLWIFITKSCVSISEAWRWKTKSTVVVTKNIVDGILRTSIILLWVLYITRGHVIIKYRLYCNNIILYILYCCSSACSNRFRNIYSYRVARLYYSSTAPTASIFITNGSSVRLI